ncbi:hypothetical protein ACG9ZL_19325 [Acinetobacter sp. ULE_I057]|uniref:hypothetical protein n=1 Tax=Acinetobacter sp. ULE_I057 TaxID=3373070 RepID=UPI003AF5EBEA
MDHYFKTDLGIQALKNRSFQLTARQRQLLLLIGTDDFKILKSPLKQRLATPELIQQLEELGLIFQNHADHSSEMKTKITPESFKIEHLHQLNQCTNLTPLPFPKEVDKLKSIITQNLNENTKSADSHTTTHATNTVISEEETHVESTSELIYINFDDIKQKMSTLLQTHCGLMTKQLVIQIQQAKSIRDIKFCQMQWITALQESRISPHELNLTMQQINYSLQHLQSS